MCCSHHEIGEQYVDVILRRIDEVFSECDDPGWHAARLLLAHTPLDGRHRIFPQPRTDRLLTGGLFHIQPGP